MENKLLKVLHAYHPNEDVKFEKADILVYRDSLILTGYEKLGDPMSSFVHYQFNDLKIPGIYNTQIQLAEDQIPNAYRSAVIKNVFHCEPTFVLVPQTELAGINSFNAYSAAYSESAEKLLNDDLDSIRSREFYNYPFRVYNDLFFAFDNAQFFSYHRPLFEVMKRKSMGSEAVFVSIKTKYTEVIVFKNGELIQCNTYEVKSNGEIADIINKNLKQVSIDASSPNIFITCVRKEEKDEIFANLRSSLTPKQRRLLDFR
jgi:Protein of unknown function (DUF3822)